MGDDGGTPRKQLNWPDVAMMAVIIAGIIAFVWVLRH